MKIQTLTVGMRVKHPQYGVGVVKAISEHMAEIRFDDATRSMDPELSELTPAEPSMSVSGLEVPLRQFVEGMLESLVERLGVEKPDAVVEQLGNRWHKGKLVLHPSDPTLTTKEV